MVAGVQAAVLLCEDPLFVGKGMMLAFDDLEAPSEQFGARA